MKNIVDIKRSIQTVDIKINNLCNDEFFIFIIEFLRRPICFDILKIESNLILNTETNC
jgi:hypothetical protein